jgi:hypothetical protein
MNFKNRNNAATKWEKGCKKFTPYHKTIAQDIFSVYFSKTVEGGGHTLPKIEIIN